MRNKNTKAAGIVAGVVLLLYSSVLACRALVFFSINSSGKATPPAVWFASLIGLRYLSGNLRLLEEARCRTESR